MTDRLPLPMGQRSIFAKLVAIMLAMTVSLIAIVAGFFWVMVGPNLGISMDRLARDYIRLLAASGPDLQAARKIAERLDLQVRYEGPDGAWSTAEDLPPIDDLLARPPSLDHFRLHGLFYVTSRPDGGRYLFSWTFGQRMRVLHRNMVLLLLGLVTFVVVAGHVVIRRSLRPLRALHEGVARLSEGQLEVALPVTSRDEFGALTAAFNEMARRVRERVQARDQLLVDVSHELRSPLTRLKVALALIPDQDKKEQMAADLDEMDAMLHELLERERLRDGRGLHREWQDLAPLLREAAAGVSGPPGVEVGALTAPILVDVDARALRTLLRNLVDNALKYSLPDSRPVRVSAAPTEDRVVVRVTDDGPGIPAADLARVFEPFFRVDRSRSKKTGGYGLGLSLCRRIAESHGGTLTAENNPERGASFVLVLPYRPGP